MITKETVTYIANLARLELTDQEKESYASQLDAVVGYVNQLDAVDVKGVEPTCFMVPEHDPLRDDVPGKSLPVDELMKNGPKVTDQFFAVPKVINQ
jgi:aspartyl-tRNA(Asn)/glutamyl-tRNA(Gln) amidotransferase subunit C